MWHLRYVTLKDNAGNTRALFESDLASAGFSASVQVTTEADTTPPVLSSLSLSPSSVDVSNGPAAVTATATVTDDLSGVLDGQTQTGIESPSTTQIAPGPLNHVNGDTYTAVLTIPQNAEAGIWHLRYATLVDAAGNHRSLFREELGAAGFTATVTVLSPHADSSPPVLHSLSINPTAVDIATGPATITASATITDDVSGVADVSSSCGCAVTSIGIEQSSTGQVAMASFVRTSGDDYTASLRIPQGAGSGTWRLRLITLRDNAGNTRTYFAADLAAMGLNPQIAVSATGSPPPATPPFSGAPSAQPPQASDAVVAGPGIAGHVSLQGDSSSGVTSTVAWPPDAFDKKVGLALTTASVGKVATGTLFAGSYGIKLLVNEVGADGSVGSPVTTFNAPLDISFVNADPATRPAYSKDGLTWIEIPLLKGSVLSPTARDGYYWHGTTLHVLTRHATIFGLFHSLRGIVTTHIYAGTRTAVVTIATSVAARATINLRRGRIDLGRWQGNVRGPKRITLRLTRRISRGVKVNTNVTLVHGKNRLSVSGTALAR